MPEFRKDPVSGQWVIIATHRAKRPHDYEVVRNGLDASYCPFCRGNEDATPGALRTYRSTGAPRSGGFERTDGEGEDWQVRVVPNKFPALHVEGSLDRHGHGVYDAMNGIGAHEVIVEAPGHVAEPGAMSVEQHALVFEAWRERLEDLERDERIASVVLFKNHGAEAGASLEHVHSQLVALPMVPRRVAERVEGARRHFEFRERCIFEDIVRQEMRERSRVVYTSPEFVAIAPYASRHPFELWLLPRRPGAHFARIDDEQRVALAEALHDIVRRLDVALDRPPFNLMLHTAPFAFDDDSFYRWHLELVPALTKDAGFERGSGITINPTSPETAAQHLREIDPDEGAYS
jgi:UDPglucose--hexose-1-phosphate uridylyltransferase